MWWDVTCVEGCGVCIIVCGGMGISSHNKAGG